jgi:hypothetical protein
MRGIQLIRVALRPKPNQAIIIFSDPNTTKPTRRMNVNTLRIHVWTRRKLRSGALERCASRNAYVSRASFPSRSLIEKKHDAGNATRTLASKATTTTRRRGGLNLNDRFSHYSHTGRPIIDTKLSQLSEPGMAHQSSQEAASRLARESEDYYLVAGVRIPKKPRPPADDGSFHFRLPIF